MKKTMLAVLAVIMVLGSLRAFAQDSMDYDLMEGKINAVQIGNIQRLIEDMRGFQDEADQLYRQDGQPRMSRISQLLSEAEIIASELPVDSNGTAIDQAHKEIELLRNSACLVVRSVKACR
jgi:hypothetical protein